MKTYSVLFILLFGQLSQALSQDIIIKRHNNYDLTRLLNTLELKETKKTEELSTRIYFMANSSGSAGYQNGEVTHNVLVAVSEYDELPEQSSWVISEFYNPELIELSTQNDHLFQLVIEHGPSDDRKRERIEYSLDSISKKNGS